ncbi:hypothetical protein MTR67_001417 [Solanum verrucosum]|uniref:CSD domain-containing protein n=1 Tax=Solanum verrucosum TaxID=315347 RepID=A0AAF0T522_SOLVR|nr:hypothetical protein MTR67_001417 [Solanum verrucosum]
MCNQGYRNTGTVKWFSDQKGFSFISPDDDDLVTKRVSVSLLIRSEGFRTLVDDGAVEFDVEPGNVGCTKVINDTGPDGAPIKGGSRDDRGGGGDQYGGGG